MLVFGGKKAAYLNVAYVFIFAICCMCFVACAKRRIVRGFICLPAKCGCSCVWFRGLVTIVCDTSRNFVNNSVNGGLTKKIGNQNSEAADDNFASLWLFAIIAVD